MGAVAPPLGACAALVDRADELVEALRPQFEADQRRLALHAYMRGLIARALPDKVKRATDAVCCVCARGAADRAAHAQSDS